MGIRSYYPRFQLPGALPSVAAAWVQEQAAVVDAADSSPTPETATAAAPESAAAVPAAPAVVPAAAAVEAAASAELAPAVRLVVEPPPVPPAPPVSLHAAPAPPRPATADRARTAAAPATQLSFQVVLITADKGLLVCNQIPLLARPGLSQGEQQLLDNLLLWLGCRRQNVAALRHFSWPLPGLSSAEPGLAARSLLGFLAQAQQEAGFSRLLMLGSSSVDCLQAEPAASTAPWQAWYSHSLAELLALPSLKRDTWQQLQTLHAGLH